MAKRDWKKAAEDAIDAMSDRLRDLLGALDDLLAPPPEPVPVPIAVRPSHDPRARR